MASSILSDVAFELLALVSRQEFYLSIVTTLFHAIIGLSIAVAAVLPVVFLNTIKRLEETIGTVSIIFNTIPALSWILLLIAAFGVFSPLPIILTVSLAVLPILLPMVAGSLKLFLSRLLELAGLVNAPLSRRFRLIVLPAYAPLIISYVRAGMGFAVKMAMVAEAFTPSTGFGSRMMLAYSLGNTPQLIALSILAVALAVGADWIGRWGFQWKPDLS